MNQMRSWTERAAAGTLPDGIDLFLSVVSGEFSLHRSQALLRPSVLLVETMTTHQAGVAEVDAVIGAVQSELTVLGHVAGAIGTIASGVTGRTALSVIADEGVRNIGAFGLPKSGREFDLPYKKSCNVTVRPLTQTFCDRFVDLVDRAHHTRGLKVVFQGMVCGGKYANPPGPTHMQRRNALVQVVFDVFYEEGHRAEAESFQAEMRGLLPSLSDGFSLRMFWGTFEDPQPPGGQLDMSREHVQKLYYDSPAEYARLQQIKQYVDPDDIFHTSFTVQLP
jgi:FAD/FMN-containing dehydrogenase